MGKIFEQNNWSILRPATLGTSDASSAVLYFAKFSPVTLGSLPISWSTLILIVFKVCLKLWSNKITTSGGNSLWVLITFYRLFLRAKNGHRLSNIWYLHVISCLNFMMTDVSDIRMGRTTLTAPKGNHFCYVECLSECHVNHIIYNYSVCVSNVINDNMVSVYFCDYGDVSVLPLEKLQPLIDQFKELPYQAIKAKLAGECPCVGQN